MRYLQTLQFCEVLKGRVMYIALPTSNDGEIEAELCSPANVASSENRCYKIGNQPNCNPRRGAFANLAMLNLSDAIATASFNVLAGVKVEV
jgi:hypothetical protein